MSKEYKRDKSKSMVDLAVIISTNNENCEGDNWGDLINLCGEADILIKQYEAANTAKDERIKELKAVIDQFWDGLWNRYNIESREEIEADTKESWTKGTSPLNVALHYIWKREPKVAEIIGDTVANLLCYLVDRYENQPLSEIKLQEIGTNFLKDKHYNKPSPAKESPEKKPTAPINPIDLSKIETLHYLPDDKQESK
jgi:hypothetical protein